VTKLCRARVDNVTPMGLTHVDREMKVSGMHTTANHPERNKKCMKKNNQAETTNLAGKVKGTNG
jgi:hypothetical protein